jgi:hypothetical protein
MHVVMPIVLAVYGRNRRTYGSDRERQDDEGERL